MAGWQKIADVLPDFDEVVLVADSRYITDGGTPLARLNQRTWDRNIARTDNDFIDTGDGFHVDYWMPIPKIENGR